MQLNFVGVVQEKLPGALPSKGPSKSSSDITDGLHTAANRLILCLSNNLNTRKF